MPIWKSTAIADRKAISKYIAQDNPLAAVDLVDLLLERAEQLDQNPDLGRVGRVAGTRELVVHKNYILVYRVTATGVEILNVVHAAMQWPPLPDQ